MTRGTAGISVSRGKNFGTMTTDDPAESNANIQVFKNFNEGVSSGRSRRDLSARSLGAIPARSRRDLGCISCASHVHLGRISAGKEKILSGNCGGLEGQLQRIISYGNVPLVQGVLKYAQSFNDGLKQAATSPRPDHTGHPRCGDPSMDGRRSCLDGYTHSLTHSPEHLPNMATHALAGGGGWCLPRRTPRQDLGLQRGRRQHGARHL